MDWDAEYMADFEATFERAWVFVGFATWLPRPDSYFVYEAAPRSLLIARDASGSLGAFVNACTHRGTRLCREAGAGRMQCPYHGWVFDTGGRLLGATGRKGLPEFDDADQGLVRQPLEQVGGCLFVHGDPSPSLDLRASLAAGSAALLEEASRRLGSTSVVERRLDGGWRDLLDETPGTHVAPNLRVTVEPNLALLTELRPQGPGATCERSWVSGDRALKTWLLRKGLRRGNRPAAGP